MIVPTCKKKKYHNLSLWTSIIEIKSVVGQRNLANDGRFSINATADKGNKY